MANRISGPSLRAQLLGQELQVARKSARVRMQDAAEFLQVDTAKISRMESATYPPKRAEVLALLDFYVVSDVRKRRLMVQLTDDIWRKGWWDGYRRDVDREFVDYPWLEARADRIMSYEVLALSGLMQTRAYATAVIQRAEGVGADDVQLQRLVELRMTRQRILDEETPRIVEAVIDESALRRLVGGTSVMRDQLEHLVALTGRPNVVIRVMPMAEDWHFGYAGPFTLFGMAEPYPDVAYAENLAGGAFVEEAADVDRFRRAYDQLQASAYTPERSREIISDIAKDLA